jgi:hypothetical protein
MRAAFQRASQVSFLFAGSIEHLMKDIFGENRRPFGNFGGFYELAPIGATDWQGGIRERLDRDGCAIDDTAIDRLIDRIKKLKGRVTSRRASKVVHAIARDEAIYTGGDNSDAEVKRAVSALHDRCARRSPSGRGRSTEDDLLLCAQAQIEVLVR